MADGISTDPAGADIPTDGGSVHVLERSSQTKGPTTMKYMKPRVHEAKDWSVWIRTVPRLPSGGT